MGCAWIPTSNWSFLSNVVREFVPAFDTRDVEISLFIFLHGFGNFQILMNSGSILWNPGSFSGIIKMIFRTEEVQTQMLYHLGKRRTMILHQVIYKSTPPYPWNPVSFSFSLLAFVEVGLGSGWKEYPPNNVTKVKMAYKESLIDLVMPPLRRDTFDIILPLLLVKPLFNTDC